MDPFDKNIQKKLSKGPDRKPDPEVWRQVREGLGGGDLGGGGMHWLRWIAIAALLLFLCSTSFFLGQKNNQYQVRQQLDEMSQAIARLNATVRDTIYIRDTLWQSLSASLLPAYSQMVQDDRGRFLKAERQDRYRLWQASDYTSNSLLQSKLPLISFDLAPPASDESNLWKGNLLQLFDTYPSAPHNDGLVLRRTGHKVQNIPFKSLLPEFHFRRLISLHPYRALYATEIIQSGRRRKIWDALLPDQHRIALVGGALNAVTEELQHPSEWLLSIQYEMSFSPRLSLLTGMRYRNFSAKNEHDLEDVPYPTPQDLIAGDQLHEIYMNNQYISVPIIVKYSIPLGRHFRPYLHSGLLFTKTISQNYKFEIDRQGMDLNLNSKIGEGPLILSSYLVGAGVEYWLSPRVSTSLDLEGRYQFKLSNIEVQKNNGLGVRLGIHYSL